MIPLLFCLGLWFSLVSPVVVVVVGISFSVSSNLFIFLSLFIPLRPDPNRSIYSLATLDPVSAHPRWQTENEQNLLDLQSTAAFHSQCRQLSLPQSAPAAASAAAAPAAATLAAATSCSAATRSSALRRQFELLIYLARGEPEQLQPILQFGVLLAECDTCPTLLLIRNCGRIDVHQGLPESALRGEGNQKVSESP